MRKYINDAHLAKKAGKTRAERMTIFLNLLAMRLKRRFGSGRTGECRVRVLGYDVWGFNYSTLEYLFREVFLSREYFFEARSAQPVIIDCGANIGMSVLYFKYLFPHARIIAFEANPSAFRLLEKNMSANGIRDVEPHNAALSDREGEISFFVSSDPGTLHGSTRGDRGGSVELTVKATRLSQCLRRQQEVDLVKMDVEGSELSIVDELVESSTLRRVGQYIVEYHHRIDGDRSVLADFLRKFETNGYDYNLKAGFRKPGAFQDVLIHFYQEKKSAAPGRSS